MGKVPRRDICTICLRKIRASNMSRHKKTHERTYFNKSSNPKIRRVYDGLKKEKKECPICKKKIHGQNMWDHIQNLHYKVKHYKCDHCGKDFSCKSNVNRHIRRAHKDELIIRSTEMFSKMNTSIDL